MSVGDVVNDAANLAFKPAELAAGLLPFTKSEPTNLSTILTRGGWGPKDSTLNRQARAVVKRESNGDPAAQNPSGATGLFQVMTPLHCGKMGTPRATPQCVAYLKDPTNNARVAKALYLAAGWTPWVASGGIPTPIDWDPVISKKDVSIVGSAVDSTLGTVGDAASAVASPFTSIAKAATELIGTLLSADTWLRIGKGGLGFGLVIIGTGALVYVAANTASGGKAATAVKTVARTVK